MNKKRYLNVYTRNKEIIPFIGRNVFLLIKKDGISSELNDYYTQIAKAKGEGYEAVLSFPQNTFYSPVGFGKGKPTLAFLTDVVFFSVLDNPCNNDSFISIQLRIKNPCLINDDDYPKNSKGNSEFCDIIHVFPKSKPSEDEEQSYMEAVKDALMKYALSPDNDATETSPEGVVLTEYSLLEDSIKRAFPSLASKEYYDYITAPTFHEEIEVLQHELIAHAPNSSEDANDDYLVTFSKSMEDILKSYKSKIDEEADPKNDETDFDGENDDNIGLDFDALFSKGGESGCSSYYDDEDDDSGALSGNGYYQEYVKKHGKSTELSKYINFLNNLDTNMETKDEIAKEILHLSHERKNTSDYTSCINWLENVMALPWNVKESADFSIDIAKEIIEKSHYGMKDVKERIIEMLAVRKKNGTNAGAIICLVGSPGVGKTSIGKSIAEALSKKFTRFSVGSLHDETDIVGHRRTYVASAPGKIMNAIRSAGAKDPVILIDEIDKAATRQGNPLSALLEVLDPEQNKNFQDVYFDFPYDLSKVVFVLTANDMSEIPLPLLDRLEVIEVRGYSENEKVHIANEFLLPKLLKNAGLKEDELKIEDDAIREIIVNYTMEEGVRNLERNLSKIIRKFVLEELTSSEKPNNNISIKDIKSYLGVPLFDRNSEIKADKPGSSLGLSKSSVGGDVLRIEVVKTKGNGTLRQTGHLGEVLKESAEVAFTLLKSMYSCEDNADEFFKNNNFHLHLPEGAIQKDGPSAGIALFSAFYSLYKNTVIKPHLAMTGEINLLGEVTPIGGLREKLLGAKRNRVTEVIVPLGNKKDVDELDAEITDGLTIHTVSNINEVIAIAFPSTLKKKTDNIPSDSTRSEATC